MGKEEAKETLGVPFHHVSTLGVLDTFQHTDERIHWAELLSFDHSSLVCSVPSLIHVVVLLSSALPQTEASCRSVPCVICLYPIHADISGGRKWFSAASLFIYLFIYLVCILKNEAMLWFNAGSGAEGNTYPTIWKREARRSFRHFDWWISLSLSSVLCYFRSLTHNLDPRCLLWLGFSFFFFF